MARILSNETSLSRQQKRLGRESGVLGRLLRAEAAAACLFLLAGAVQAFRGRGTGFLWAGGALGFLACAHYLKTRQNALDTQYMAAGLRGENEVARILADGLDHSYYLFNDLSIRSGFSRAQIDHLVVSPKGIFLLETKNWRGRLTGGEEDRRWLQYRNPDQPPRALNNPVLQNRRHVAVLGKFLQSGGAPALPIVPMLVFTGRNTSFEIKDQKSLLLWPRETLDYILRYSPERVWAEADVDAVLHRLQRCA